MTKRHRRHSTAKKREIVEAYDAALARGEGAITVNGKMVDVPVADRMRAILEFGEAIAARKARQATRA